MASTEQQTECGLGYSMLLRARSQCGLFQAQRLAHAGPLGATRQAAVVEAQPVPCRMRVN